MRKTRCCSEAILNPIFPVAFEVSASGLMGLYVFLETNSRGVYVCRYLRAQKQALRMSIFSKVIVDRGDTDDIRQGESRFHQEERKERGERGMVSLQAVEEIRIVCHRFALSFSRWLLVVSYSSTINAPLEQPPTVPFVSSIFQSPCSLPDH